MQMSTLSVTSSQMNAKLRKAAPPATDERLVPEMSSREASMIAEHADCRLLGQNDPFGHRLRNRIILANAIAWIAIIALIRLMFSLDRATVPAAARMTRL
jgi:hypothetical protein